MRPVIFALAASALIGFAGDGWCLDESPAEASASAPATFDTLVCEYVIGLGYPDGVATDFLEMVRNWDCISWEQKLEQVRRDYREKKASTAAVAQAEEEAARSLYQTIRRKITLVPYKADSRNEDYFYLSKVIKDKKAQCLGVCQLLYVVGNSMGLQIKVIEVSIARSDRLPLGAGHVACLVDLTGGRVMMVDVAFEFASRPFVFEEEFLAVGNYYELQRKSNPLRIHQRIRLVDANGLVSMIYYDLAISYREAGRGEQELRLVEKAMELDPNLALAYHSRGLLYDKLGKYAEAISDFTKAIELNPKYSQAYCYRGVAYGKSGQRTEAISDFTTAIQLNPEDADTFNNRAFANSQSGRYAEAILDCTKAIDLNPRFSRAYHNRGVAYALLGKKDEAKKDLQKVVELNPASKAEIRKISDKFQLGLE